MSSPLKGAVAFKIDEESHSLSFSAEALYRLEKQLGKSVNEIGDLVQDSKSFNMALVRTMFWAGMLDEKPDLDLEGVGPIFRRLPMLQAIDLVTRAFTGAFVDPDAPAPEKPASP